MKKELYFYATVAIIMFFGALFATTINNLIFSGAIGFMAGWSVWSLVKIGLKNNNL